MHAWGWAEKPSNSIDASWVACLPTCLSACLSASLNSFGSDVSGCLWITGSLYDNQVH